MAKDPPKRMASRWTLSPLYLAAGLAVLYLILTRMVPAMHAIADDGPRAVEPVAGWPGLALKCSQWVRANATATIAVFTVLAIGGVVAPFVIRPARYLVWVAAIGVFLLDVALAAGGYWNMVSHLLNEANKVGGG